MCVRLGRLAIIGVVAFVTLGGPSAVDAQQRATVPDESAINASRRAANELFGEQFRAAKTGAAKAAVAAKMIESALKLQDGSADQYALLMIAREIAAGAGDATTALQAADSEAQRFDVPAAKLRAETLVMTARAATMLAQHKAVAEVAATVVSGLSDADEIDLALDVCNAATATAQKSRQFAIAKDLAQRAVELKKQQAAVQAYRRAVAVMEDAPTEPTANLTAGRYLCLVKGDWERGVPYLALGSDPVLKAAAVVELRGAASPDEQIVIGDAWWDAAGSRPDDEQDAFRHRAGAWYRKAEPRLAGSLAGLKIKERLAEVAKLGEAASSDPIQQRPGPQTPPLAVAPFDPRTAKQHQATWAAHLKVPVVWANANNMSFVLIPPGEFEMESVDVSPRHRVHITRPFYLSVTQVTQSQYARAMGANPSFFKEDNRPVEQVSWDQAMAFCQRLSQLPEGRTGSRTYRLPTEAEWEHACRCGTTTKWHAGDDPAGLDRVAWYLDNSGRKTHPVGQKEPNAWGLHDMYGNVWEWCSDWFGEYPAATATDPTGAVTGSNRVLRGGSWRGNARDCGSASRQGQTPAEQSVSVGFRVAISLERVSNR